jgi:hypothetical protein
MLVAAKYAPILAVLGVVNRGIAPDETIDGAFNDWFSVFPGLFIYWKAAILCLL